GAADEQVAARGPAQLQERRDAPGAGAAAAGAARDVGGAVPQAEADPESFAPLGVLRPGRGCRDAEQPCCRENARCRTHRTLPRNDSSGEGDFHAGCGQRAARRWAVPFRGQRKTECKQRPGGARAYQWKVTPRPKSNTCCFQPVEFVAPLTLMSPTEPK